MKDFDATRRQELMQLMDDYTIRTPQSSEPPTLMQIAGFPHWENVYSNILAFLLDTEQPHGFGPLLLRSLVSLLAHESIDLETIQATDKVSREVSTSSGKRIDIVIECASLVICVENKIWSGLHNDLGEYRAHCKSIAKANEKLTLGIVLSPHGVESPSLAKHDFSSITYGDLVAEVQRQMGSHLGPHNTRYQYLLFDFLDQASRFSRSTTMSDDQQAFLDFWRKNDQKIENLNAMCNSMWSALNAKQKAQAHIEACTSQLTEAEQAVFRTWIYYGATAVFDLAEGGHIDACGIYYDVAFHPLRITHIVGKRRGCSPEALVSRIAQATGLAFESRDGGNGQTIVVNDPPYGDHVLAKALETSVAILKQVAALRIGSASPKDI